MTEDVALLLARASFGPTAAELAVARKAGYAATLSTLLDPAQPDIGATSAPEPRLGLDPYADLRNPTDQQRAKAYAKRDQQIEVITRWWLDRMTVADHQGLEKLVFFWHGHWATSVDKVRSAQLMLLQNRTMRQARDFAEMTRKMVLDPALVYWLDGHLNTKKSPNENLARELMELFLLGIGNYTEKDVKEAGRALTGYRVSLGSEACIMQPEHYDGGRKTILGVTGAIDAPGLADVLLRRKECPRFIASRMWFRYASSSQPIPAGTREAMAAAFPAPRAMLRALFEDEAFGATARTMVKQPVEWLVGAMRQLGLRLGGLPAETLTTILTGLRAIGQIPFAPPSVGGWAHGGSWLTSAAGRVRLVLAGTLAELAKVDQLTPEEVAYILCVDGWTDRTYKVLRDVKDPRHMLTLGMASPEYLVT
jgi:uncharacterized protein (DUF1800 family)